MPDTRWHKARYLDASVLIKLVVHEGDSQPIRDFFNTNVNFCTTPLCLAEALGRLKGMWKKGKLGHRKLSTDGYFEATCRLIANARGKRIKIDDVELIKQTVHANVEKMARKHDLDLSDALQLITVLKGRYSSLGPNSASVLITADGSLATAAQAEGIRVWNCIREPRPRWA